MLPIIVCNEIHSHNNNNDNNNNNVWLRYDVFDVMTSQRASAPMTSSAPIVQYACFNTIFEIVCAGSRDLILFEAARYGRNDTWGAHVCDVPITRNCDIDVQYPLSRTCGGRKKCSLAVNTAFFGDPCGYEEFLKVTYRCVPGGTFF